MTNRKWKGVNTRYDVNFLENVDDPIEDLGATVRDIDLNPCACKS